MSGRPWIFCADIGSVKAGRFGWYGVGPEETSMSGSSIEALSTAVAEKLSTHNKVALGFECPLFVPLREDPMSLTKARNGEGNRSWSAGAGCGVLAIGLVEVTWLLGRIRVNAPSSTTVFLEWKLFEQAEHGLFLWEAFVSGKAKGSGHVHDAKIAVQKFLSCLPNPEVANAISEKTALSLIGSMMIRTGWSSRMEDISEPCLVIKA